MINGTGIENGKDTPTVASTALTPRLVPSPEALT